jgi:L-ascorbate metabolism protein UlaG (beta-lactamase superfamily)
MNRRSFHLLAGLCLITGGLGWLAWLNAQQPPQFTGIRLLTNSEIGLTFIGPVGTNYRIDATTTLSNWSALVTFPTNTTTSLQYTDSAARFLEARFYRATELTGSNIISGDHLATTNGEVILHPLFHATFMMNWNGINIYNDPADDAAFQSRYLGLPKADLILVSHSHSDHFSAGRINSVRGTNAVIVAPQAVYNSLSAALKAITIVLTNGASTNVVGVGIDAIPAYNSNHPLGSGNGYVVTLGGKRVFISGDTGNIAEMRALADIDVAFVCMNIPFTMTVNEATNAISAFRPRVVYPYHYRDQSGNLGNANTFKQRLDKDLGIEVRLRRWY